MILLREKLARLLQYQHSRKLKESGFSSEVLETWEEISEFRQFQYLEKADEIIALFVEAIKGSEFKAENQLRYETK